MIKLSVNQTTNNRSIYFSIKQVKYLLIYLSHTPEPILVLLLFEEPMTGKSLKHRESVPQWLHFVIYWHQMKCTSFSSSKVPTPPHFLQPTNKPTTLYNGFTTTSRQLNCLLCMNKVGLRFHFEQRNHGDRQTDRYLRINYIWKVHATYI